MSNFVVSLDFELFWGVAESRTVAEYTSNVYGEWRCIPEILLLFRKFGIRTTWATVGMVLCKDYSHWREVQPKIQPSYQTPALSTYILDELITQNPKLFFARPLVRRILDTPGQEIASHSYSHFYCGVAGATPEQFAADLVCAREVAADLGVNYRSFVFPRNQVQDSYLEVLTKFGYRVYRGNPPNWLYASGHKVAGGIFGRSMRFADAYVPLTGPNLARPTPRAGLMNCSASAFLRPWSRRLSAFEPLRLRRIKQSMLAAALGGETFHLWWHPHNFGVNIEENLAVLESILQYYRVLHDQYGMQSVCMGDWATETAQ
jgi:peptidoglycan/xylan/chitin deacetylase (PgdA/CDA1 family)